MDEAGRKKVVAGKLDPFYHFSTLPDTAKTTSIAIAASRSCIPEP
jgi:hypothetical protein